MTVTTSPSKTEEMVNFKDKVLYESNRISFLQQLNPKNKYFDDLVEAEVAKRTIVFQLEVSALKEQLTVTEEENQQLKYQVQILAQSMEENDDNDSLQAKVRNLTKEVKQL